MVPEVGLEPTRLSASHFECDVAAITPLRRRKRSNSAHSTTGAAALRPAAAFACPLLCSREDDRFAAYLAGMVADIGMICALRILDEDYREARAPDTEEFHEALAGAVAAVSAPLAQRWDFDPRVCRAVARRLDDAPSEAGDGLGEALSTAGRVSKLHVLAPALAGAALQGLGEAERRCYLELERAFGRPA